MQKLFVAFCDWGKIRYFLFISLFFSVVSSAELSITGGGGIGYSNWDKWSGSSYTGFAELRVPGFPYYSFGLELFYSETKVEKSDSAIYFSSWGGLFKASLLHTPRTSLRGGIGYGFIPSFQAFGTSVTGVSSLLLSLGVVLHTPLTERFRTNLRIENIFFTGLKDFYNPTLELSFTYRLAKPKPVRKEEVAVKRKEVYHPSPKAKPKYPPDIGISNIVFSEPSGNNALDAYEKGAISFTIQNKGKGDAVGVEVKVVGLTGTEGVSFPKAITVGTISSEIPEKVKIELSASELVQDGTIKLRIEANERFGFDADLFNFTVESRAFVPPKLVIADIGIDDDKKGVSQGDNDGIIELAEAVEVTVGIQNVGAGDAEDVIAKVKIEGEGDNIYYGAEKKVFYLGVIKSGDYKMVKFVFTTSKRYAKENLPVSIKVTEKRGKYGFEEPLGLAVNKPTKRITEIRIARKEIPKPSVKKRVELSIDVDNIPVNSLTMLGNGICIILGIEEYKQAPSATFANRDAAIFYEYAKSVFGIPERNIYIRTNEDATKGEFDKIFGEDGWLSRRVIKGESNVFIYFSGHGAYDVKRNKVYLVPYDIDPNYASSAYPLDEIYEQLRGLHAQSVTVFLDACFSGQSRDGTMLLADARPFTTVKLSKAGGGITVFCATGGSQISSSYPEKKHGLFTYYLLKGLGGNADTNKNREIKVRELFEYVKNKVEEKARLMDREQLPTLEGPEDRVLVRLR